MSGRCIASGMLVGIYVSIAIGTAGQATSMVQERCGHPLASAKGITIGLFWPLMPAIALVGQMVDSRRPSTAEFCEAAR